MGRGFITGSASLVGFYERSGCFLGGFLVTSVQAPRPVALEPWFFLGSLGFRGLGSTAPWFKP